MQHVAHRRSDEGMELGQAVAALVSACHFDAKSAGWHTEEKIGVLEIVMKLCLVHSEISEALEGIRKDKMDDHLPHRKAFDVELADACIRIFDLAGATGADLPGALVEKMAYNRHRKDHRPEERAKDGGKKF